MDKYTIFIFTGLLLIFFLLTFFFVPETKAKTVDIIYEELSAGQVWRKHKSLPQQHQVVTNEIGPVNNGNNIEPVNDENDTANHGNRLMVE